MGIHSNASGNEPVYQPARSLALRRVGSFFLPLLLGLVGLSLALGITLTVNQAAHRGRVLTGVSVMGLDLSRLSQDEMRAQLSSALDATLPSEIVLLDPNGQPLRFSPAELGIRADIDQTAAAAYAIGRQGTPLRQLQDTFQSWYYGHEVAPVILLDELALEKAIRATGIEREAISASFDYDDSGHLIYGSPQIGRAIDRDHLRHSLVETIRTMQPAQIELLVHENVPAVYDPPAVAGDYQSLANSTLQFYFPEPLFKDDLQQLKIEPIEAARWLRVELVTLPDGTQQHRLAFDENAIRNWLNQIATQIHRAPVNARYYFDDDTRELVLIAPHVNGRELDIEATAQAVRTNLQAGNRSIPIIMRDVMPQAHSAATGPELGITELITETTTWFYGSSDERKHNIARAAANFYGIVIAPGEEFSFNRYLGSISEADGYAEGLVIVGGRTIEGIGGGVCQVSTTIYQTAFWSGFPIVERWAHGYMVNYYNDGEGPGMDATVYQPIVDFRFINNTPHHLLIENYYSEEFQSLTFKFYSTSMGRRVVKGEPSVSNITPAPTEDIWDYDADMPEGTVQQYDYAADGADVTIQRTVYNANGEIIDDRAFVSNYIPWPNVYRYGPGVEPGDYSLVNNEN